MIKELPSTYIKLLSILWMFGPQRISNLRTMLSRIVSDLPPGYTSTNKNSQLRQDLDALCRKELLLFNLSCYPQAWSISPRLGFDDFHELISTDECLGILPGVRSYAPMTRSGKFYYYRASDEFICALERELSLAILNGDLNAYKRVIAVEKEEIDRRRDEIPFHIRIWKRLFGENFSFPASLSASLIPEAFSHILPLMLDKGVSIDAWLARLDVLPDTAFAECIAGFTSVASCLLWTGDRKRLETLRRFVVDNGMGFHLEACFHFMDGRWNDAEKAFQRALTCLSKESETNKNLWQDYTSPTYAITAIKAQVSQSKIKQTAKRCRIALMERGSSYGYMMESGVVLLDNIVNHNKELDTQGFKEWGQLNLAAGLIASQLFWGVDKNKVAAGVVKSVVVCAATARALGLHLAAAMLLSAVKQLGGISQKDDEYLLKTISDLQLKLPWKVVEPEDLWQVALGEIEALIPAQEKKGAKVSNQEKVVSWQLRMSEEKGEYEVHEIEPRLCSYLASGGLSAGRRMALAKMQAGEYDEYLSDAEKTIKNAIVSYGGWGTKHYYIGSSGLPGLVDNPHVFEQAKGGKLIPVRIISGESSLQVEKASGGYNLHLPFSSKALRKGMTLRLESPGVYKLYVFDERLVRLGNLLKKYSGAKEKLFVPEHGEKRFMEVVARIAGAVPVAGNLNVDGVKGVREIKGKVELHMRIVPSGQGLSMELFNHPVAELPNMFAAGMGAPQTFVEADNEKLLIARNIKQEKNARSELLAACPAMAAWETSANRWDVDDLEMSLRTLGQLHDAAAQVALEWPEGQEFKLSRRMDFKDFNFSVGLGADAWLTIGGDVKVDEHEVARLAQVLQKLPEAVGDFIPLDDRRYLRLTTKMRRQLEELSSALNGKGEALTASAGALPLLMDTIPEEIQSGFGAAWRKRTEAFRRALEITPAVPKGFQGELRPYQQDGFVWLSRLYEWGVGACLADDMGLGKTIQALALLLDRAAAGPSLVIAPASVCRNWLREAARFAPGLNVSILGGSDRVAEIEALKKYDVVICSYGIMVSEEELLIAKDWNCVVLDEAQAIKNHQSKRARAVRKLKAKFRLASTGTPLENNLDELWSLFDFINPGLLGNHAQFNKKFMSGASPAHALKKLVGPFILRRLKTQVLDELPPKTEITLEVTLSDKERGLYETLRREALLTLSGEGDNSHIGILAQLTRLRRACCHPALVAPEAHIAGTKMELLADLVDELRSGGHRALIFSQFVDCLSIVRKSFDERNIPYQYLDGSTPVPERMTRVDAFQHGEGDFFLISLKAGGTGLNLTAANYVILLDPWWNPAVENQAADRAHRIGQEQSVTVYRLITAGTVEERVIELHARKREMAEEILEGAEKTRLSKDELMQLFQ
jgi:superfamily II DNA or RNA helicase